MVSPSVQKSARPVESGPPRSSWCVSPVTSLKPHFQSHWGTVSTSGCRGSDPAQSNDISPGEAGREGRRDAGGEGRGHSDKQPGDKARREGDRPLAIPRFCPAGPAVLKARPRFSSGHLSLCVVCVYIRMLVVVYLLPTLECIYLSGKCRFIRVGLFFILLNYLLNDHLFWSQGFCPGQSEVLMMSSSPPLSP